MASTPDSTTPVEQATMEIIGELAHELRQTSYEGTLRLVHSVNKDKLLALHNWQVLSKGGKDSVVHHLRPYASGPPIVPEVNVRYELFDSGIIRVRGVTVEDVQESMAIVMPWLQEEAVRAPIVATGEIQTLVARRVKEKAKKMKMGDGV